MSSGKAPADQQKASHPNPNNPPQQQRSQPPSQPSRTATPLSYSSAAGGSGPPRPSNISTSTMPVRTANQAQSVSGLAPTAPAFRPGNSNSAVTPTLPSASPHVTHSATLPPHLQKPNSAILPKPTQTSLKSDAPAAVSNGDAATRESQQVSDQQKSSQYRAPGQSGKQDPSSQQQEESKPKKLTFFDEQYNRQGPPGDLGDAVNIRANRFSIVDDKTVKFLYVYSVSFPEINKRPVKNANVKRSMLERMLSVPPLHARKLNHQIFTDWDSVIISKDDLQTLPQTQSFSKVDENKFEVDYSFQNQSSSTSETYRAGIALVHKLDMEDLRKYTRGEHPADFDFGKFTRALNILVRHLVAANTRAFRVGQNRFFREQPQQQLPSKLLARLGFFNTVRPVKNGWQLQLNTSAAAFYPDQPLLEFVIARFPQFNPNFDPQNASEREIETFRKVWPEVKSTIRILRVQYLYTPQDPTVNPNSRSQILARVNNQSLRKRINGFGKAATEEKFSHDFWTSQETWTVQEHFDQHVLQHPLQCTGLPVVNVGAKDRAVWVPMELLSIEPGQALNSTVPQGDMKDMGRFSRKSPAQNVSFIERDGLQLMQTQELRVRNVINIGTRLLSCKGRMLPVPNLQYRNGPLEVAPQGQWTSGTSGKWKLEGQKFHTGSDLGKLLIITVGGVRPLQNHQINKFKDALVLYGVTCTGSHQTHAYSTNHHDLNTAYDALRKDGKYPKVIFVVVENNNADNYASIKSWGDMVKGVSTICFTGGKLNYFGKPEFHANLALKFNAKLGGKNHILNEGSYSMLHGADDEETMVVGADVTHPGPSSMLYCPSIAAVVASTDKDCVTFPGSLRLQRSRSERIIDLQAMMEERLLLWRKPNGKLPARILFYRDGVGEDQFAMVKRHELPQVQAACTKIASDGAEPDYKPKITLVVCTKRHANRFYPSANANDTEPRLLSGGNFKPGLVVDDSAIRLPYYFDFWLQGHQPLQGTGCPCHYFVLENGIGYTSNELQQATFALSWVYATSVTPISVAAPAYYADKLCERGRCYIRPLLIGRHPLRPDEDKWNGGVDGFGNTDDEKRDAVADKLTNGAFNFWYQKGQNGTTKPNPCHVALTDTMFYI